MPSIRAVAGRDQSSRGEHHSIDPHCGRELGAARRLVAKLCGGIQVGEISRIAGCAPSHPATSEADTVRFNMINPATGNRIKMNTVDAGTGEDVSRGDS